MRREAHILCFRAQREPTATVCPVKERNACLPRGRHFGVTQAYIRCLPPVHFSAASYTWFANTCACDVFEESSSAHVKVDIRAPQCLPSADSFLVLPPGTRSPLAPSVPGTQNMHLRRISRCFSIYFETAEAYKKLRLRGGRPTNFCDYNRNFYKFLRLAAESLPYSAIG